MSRLQRRLLLVGFAALVLITVVGFIIFVASGTFLSSSGCWETQRHPDTNATFSSPQEYREAVHNYATQNTDYTDFEIDQLLNSKEYRVVTRNGTDVVQTRNPDLICDQQRTVS